MRGKKLCAMTKLHTYLFKVNKMKQIKKKKMEFKYFITNTDNIN